MAEKPVDAKKGPTWGIWHEFALNAFKGLLADYIAVHDEQGFDVRSRDGVEKNKIFDNAQVGITYLEKLRDDSGWKLPEEALDVLDYDVEEELRSAAK